MDITDNLHEYVRNEAKNQNIDEHVIELYISKDDRELKYKICLSVNKFVALYEDDDDDNDHCKVASSFNISCPSIQDLRTCCYIYSRGLKKNARCEKHTMYLRTYCNQHASKVSENQKQHRNVILDRFIEEITDAKAWKSAVDCFIKELENIPVFKESDFT